MKERAVSSPPFPQLSQFQKKKEKIKKFQLTKTIQVSEYSDKALLDSTDECCYQLAGVCRLVYIRCDYITLNVMMKQSKTKWK